jgi:tyrosyl-tRNA synthetase
VQERSGNEKDHILVDLSEIDIRDINLLNLCAKLIPEDSRTAMRRLIHDGSVKLDGVKVLDSNAIVGFLGDNLIVSIGKHRSFKVTRKREPVLSSVKTTNSP